MAIDKVTDELALARQQLLAKGPEHHALLIHQRRERLKKQGSAGGDGDGEGREGGVRASEEEKDPEIFPSAEAPSSEGSDDGGGEGVWGVQGKGEKASKARRSSLRGNSSAPRRGVTIVESRTGSEGSDPSTRGAALRGVARIGRSGSLLGAILGEGGLGRAVSSDGARSPRQSSLNNNVFSRTKSARDKFQATFRSGKMPAAFQRKKAPMPVQALTEGEDEYLEQQIARAEALLEHLASSGGRLRAIEDALKSAKVPSKQALASLRTAERSSGGGPDVAKAMKAHRSAESLVEMLTDRVGVPPLLSADGSGITAKGLGPRT